ncbi:MAG TPA: ribonuclease P protein component 1 [Methanosarcinales archaeon]|nr:ribonuclease P protein component 1 [Methanosarcinales archaeon]
MKITPHNLILHELIGLVADIIESTNSSLIGIKGKVVFETRNTIIIEDQKDLKEKIIPKSCVTFIFTLPDARVKVNGKLLVSRPEDRIKKNLKKVKFKLNFIKTYD